MKEAASIHHTIIYSYHTIYESEITNYFVPGVPLFFMAIKLFKKHWLDMIQGNSSYDVR